MRTMLCAAVIAVVGGCAGSTGPAAPLRALVIHFDRAPTAADSAAIAVTGAAVASVTSLTRTVGAWSTAPISTFSAIAHVTGVDDLRSPGYQEVFLAVQTASAVTVGDSTYLASISEPEGGHTAWRGGDSTLWAYTTLAGIAGLDLYPRFIAASAQGSSPFIPAGAGRDRDTGIE